MLGRTSCKFYIACESTDRGLFDSFFFSDEVSDLGWKMLDGLYQQAVVIAKQITKKENDDEAVLEFRKHLNSSEMYFNEHPFPENESNEEAFRKCKSEKGANVLISAIRPNYVNTYPVVLFRPSHGASRFTLITSRSLFALF